MSSAGTALGQKLRADGGRPPLPALSFLREAGSLGAHHGMKSSLPPPALPTAFLQDADRL